MGPTASGKSSLAMYLSANLNGEIVSVDSMQIYTGLDIGTAKPTTKDQGEVRHHLIDVCPFNERFDVYRFVEAAERAISDIQSRGKLPVLSGGTGMYFKALLYGLDPLPGDAGLRSELDAEFDHEEGHEKLKKLMREIDPEDYERWHSHRRKLIRALEVFKLTGQSITRLQTINKPSLRYPVESWLLWWDRAVLRQRIADRTGLMLESGWIEEAERAIADGILESPTAHQAIGYRIIALYLNGSIDFDTMRERIITGTWQYARRQLTWFSRQHPEARKIAVPAEHNNLLELMKSSLK